MGIPETEITLAELYWAIKKLKNGKAPGPDGIPVECYKKMKESQLKIVLQMINNWWTQESVEDEVTQALVILLFKKGDKSNLANYRPISLLNTNYKLLAAIIQKRIADSLDKHLQRTQYGFRQQKGTTQATHYVRRIVEKGEMTRTKTLMVLLDWEKAFDKVKHEKLFEALARMNIPTKIINMVKALYKNPTFRIEMDNQESAWTPQQTGIRQGCPLSPYLFLIVMSCLFHDVHLNDHLKLEEHRVKGMNEDEILYADDTICISENEEAMCRLLAEIEKLGSTYGLKLNKDKCEYIKFGEASRVKFSDGTPVPLRHEVKYLGCKLNDEGDPRQEISKRMQDCMIALNKLHVFFYNTNNKTSSKNTSVQRHTQIQINVWSRSSCHESTSCRKLNTFQLKCFRNILQIPTTYINKSYSNAHVLTLINNKLKEENQKPVTMLTDYHQKSRIKLLMKLIVEGDNEPGTSVTFNPDLSPMDWGKKRVGQPRKNWYKTTIEDLWVETKKNIAKVKYASVLDFNNKNHIQAVRDYSKQEHDKRT